MSIREEAINRMLRILERLARKLTIAVSLPIILRQGKFKYICQQYGITDVDKILHSNRINEENNRSNDAAASSLSDREVTVIGNCSRNTLELQWPVILENLRKYENEISSMLHEATDESASIYKEIIKHVESLRIIAEWQMRLTPKQLRERRIELRNAKTMTLRTEEEIAKLESAFKDEMLKRDESAQKSATEIDNLRGVIAAMRADRQQKLEQQMSSYKATVHELRRDSNEEGFGLQNQLQAHERMLEALTLADLEQEKRLRELCKEAETAYFIARDAYDEDLSKLNELNETLQMQLDVTTSHYNVLKNEYEVQSVLFLNLKKERELAIMQAFTERLDRFEKNRAARIIQRTWRAYHERISAKKKKKSRRGAK